MFSGGEDSIYVSSQFPCDIQTREYILLHESEATTRLQDYCASLWRYILYAGHQHY
jgi:hypothetical protein